MIMAARGTDTEHIETYVGSEDAVWHAAVAWSNGETFTTVDGNDSAAVDEALQPSLFGGDRRIIIRDIHRVEMGVLSRRPAGVRIAGVITGKAPTGKKVAHLSITTCDRAWAQQQIRRIFRDAGLVLEARAGQYLAERLDTDLGKVRSVATVAALCGIDRLDLASVRDLVGEVRPETKIYEVADAVFAGDVANAIIAAGDIEPYPLAANLAESVRVLWAAKVVRDPRELVERFGVHPYVAKRRINQARPFDVQHLEAGLRAACETELLVRQGRCGSREAVARVAFALVGGVRR